jgi:hypothetical protein
MSERFTLKHAIREEHGLTNINAEARDFRI